MDTQFDGISQNRFIDFFRLFFLNLRVQFYNLFEYLKVIVFYYNSLSFLKIDSYLILSYLFTNPFKISKKFLMDRGEKNVHKYGETPLTTFDSIIKTCQITSKDRFYELGCGRGRTCFWIHNFIGCEVVGIEIIPEFIKRASLICNKFQLNTIQFCNQNFLTSDLKAATVIYLYGTCYDDEFLYELANKFNELLPGTKVISVSFPLTDYSKSFEVLNRFLAIFPWGETDVYLQIKK